MEAVRKKGAEEALFFVGKYMEGNACKEGEMQV